MEREYLTPAPRVQVDLQATACTTLLGWAGAYQLTLESVLADQGIELHSTYLGHRLAGYLATTHLAVVAGQGPRVYLAPDGDAEHPIGDRRRDCLVHHLDQLRILAAETTGGRVVVDVSEAALVRMDETGPARASIPAKDPGGAGH
ncbi:MAG: hypothetical protein QOE44_2945 [Solirubrobacteraceae bacterium]|nr:hypothetical protein [Solirubrobacteraceae bacterium]